MTQNRENFLCDPGRERVKYLISVKNEVKTESDFLDKQDKSSLTHKLNRLIVHKTDQSHSRKLNPLTPTSDQDRISPYNIHTKSRIQVMTTKKSRIRGL